MRVDRGLYGVIGGRESGELNGAGMDSGEYLSLTTDDDDLCKSRQHKRVRSMLNSVDEPMESGSSGGGKRSKGAKKDRSAVACLGCRKKHLKCPGGEPCSRCFKNGIACEYIAPSKKIVVSMNYLTHLQDTIAELKKDNSKLHAMLSSDNVETPKAEFGNGSQLLEMTGQRRDSTVHLLEENSHKNEEISSNFAQRSGRIIELSLGQALFIGSSSMTLFGMEIQSLITTYVTNKEFKPLPMLKRDILTMKPSSLFKVINGNPNSVEKITKLTNLRYQVEFNEAEFYHAPPKLELCLPTYPYACLLVDKFIFYNDACFYFFNEGLVRHGLRIIYQSDENLYDNATVELICYCKLFLIFAIGEIYHRSGQENDTDDNDLPGSKWFLQASRIFNIIFSGEHLQLLTKEGGIETLLLYAFYLQIADNTILAYFYFGQALRTCLVLGMHVDSQSDTLSRFEIEHRRRLWWTVYMFERMLSSKAGLPISFTDYTISTELPSDFNMFHPPKDCENYLFPESELLSNCVKIVQINGLILGQLYQKQPKDNILPVLQNIIKQLFQWKSNLSIFCQVDFSEKDLKITRQLTNLFTEYFQGINLAIRPLLFHFVSIQLKSFKDNNTYLNLEDYSESTTMLLNCSLQASVHTIRSLWELLEPDMIALFGYMDREYLFTSSCTLLLFTTTFGIHEQTYEHLDHALIIFDKMISLGNNSAELRRAQLLTLMINLDFHNLLKDLILKHTTDYDVNSGNESLVSSPTMSEEMKSLNDNDHDDLVPQEPMSTLDDLINSTIAHSYSAPLTKQGTKIIETNANQLDPTTSININDMENLLDELIKSNETDNKLWKEITDQAMWLGNSMDPTAPAGTDVDFGIFPLEDNLS